MKKEPLDGVSPLSKDQLEKLQKENPDVVIGTMSQEEIDKARESIQKDRELEEEFPLLKRTDDNIGLFMAKSDMRRARSEFIEKLECLPISAAIADWLVCLNEGTKRNYAYYLTDMIRRGIIPEEDASGNTFTVGHFNRQPHERMIDYIKGISDWSEGTRQVRAAVYISFTAYLNRISQGWFRKVEPSTLPSNKTFYSVRDKCQTEALSLHEWHRFIAALYKYNARDALIAKCLLQGAKRISEVIELKLDQIDFDKRIIRFQQSKTKGTKREIPITYPASFMEELKQYLETTKEQRGGSSYIFITRKGKKVYRTQLNHSFERASKKAGLNKVTPHQLRATWVTLAKREEIPDTEIMKVTGHSSSKMIFAYDKTSAEDNYSKKMVLI
jgi:integrase/recombinase XerD